MVRHLSFALILLALASCTQSPSASTPPGAPLAITVDAAHPGAAINPAMWGGFFEDINFGGDGGLYAELVKNRGFEFPDPMMGWFKISPSLAHGDVQILTDSPYKAAQSHYAEITSTAAAPIGISNEGFRGMGLVGGDTYAFSAEFRNVSGNSKVTVELVAEDGTTLASAPITGISANWSKVDLVLRPNATDAHARIALFLNGPGKVDVDFVSLFPQKTWKGRQGGLRADMVEALADLHPGFLRFPGGCIVEGSDLSRRYQWKNTIGPIDERKTLVDRWNYEFKWRPTPDYYQSFGLGFFEFFQLCEDLHSRPLPIVNAGMACQFNSGELCTPQDLHVYVQDALDLIEFANGPASSTWGAKRAAMGHPEPFNPPLTMLGVGNEQWGPQYLERLTTFTKAIKEKYPDIQLVSDAGPSPDDDRFAYLWPKLQQFDVDGHHADIVDQHCYANPIWFLANTHRFDSYDRKGPKVFFGEYAAQSDAICSTKNKNNLECALAEAAYMTGLERNADVVRMASYAPLFANEDAWQWRPDMIWANSLHTMLTPNFYVQQLYCENRGDVVLPTSNNGSERTLPLAGRIALGTQQASGEFYDVRISRPGAAEQMLDSVSQPDPSASVSTPLGDRSWSDYTLTLKARRTSPTGALVINVLDDDTHARASRAQWILGAPVGGPTVADPSKPEFILQSHFAEQDQLLGHTPGTLEPNRWYSVKIEVRGDQITCSLDGKVIQTAALPRHTVPAIFTTAALDEQTHAVIIKVVNPGDAATPATLSSGLDRISAASATTLAGDPDDENTFAAPDHIAPRTVPLHLSAPTFTYTFPAHSFTVLRLNP